MTSRVQGGSEKKTSMPPFPRRGTRAKLSRGEWVFLACAAVWTVAPWVVMLVWLLS